MLIVMSLVQSAFVFFCIHRLLRREEALRLAAVERGELEEAMSSSIDPRFGAALAAFLPITAPFVLAVAPPKGLLHCTLVAPAAFT